MRASALSRTRTEHRRVSRSRKDERGASLVEYALLVALIAVVLTIAIGSLGDAVNDSFSGSAGKIDAANLGT
ncbi:MAG: Flp family type IVb pilin [Microthrixaceae bacterium]